MTSYVSRETAARQGERRGEETRHGSGSDWGSGQPHTLAVGAASFEFTAKYVAILCFARIWLRQAPLFDRNECECAFVSKAPQLPVPVALAVSFAFYFSVSFSFACPFPFPVAVSYPRLLLFAFTGFKTMQHHSVL